MRASCDRRGPPDPKTGVISEKTLVTTITTPRYRYTTIWDDNTDEIRRGQEQRRRREINIEMNENPNARDRVDNLDGFAALQRLLLHYSSI